MATGMTETETRQQAHDLAEMDVVDAQFKTLAWMFERVDSAVEAAREHDHDS